jgi:putative N-acetylmannosamine-6-phosphate epimerase
MRKEAQAVRSYQDQFTPEDMEMLLQILDAKERLVAEGSSYTHAEALKVMHPLKLHCGL